jgi:hypothetical protein
LLLYFAPPAKPVAKSAFEWVAKAAYLPKSTRPSYACVWVRGQVAVATDGRRLHTAPVDLPDGNYCPKTGLLLDADHFAGRSDPPQNWRRLLGWHKDVETVPLSSYQRASSPQGTEYLCRKGHSGVNSIDAKYLREACNGCMPDVLVRDPDGKFIHVTETRSWVIMGAKL